MQTSFKFLPSIAKPLKKAGWEIQTLEVDGRFEATIAEDILQWNYESEPTPDVIFSGVPCENYSIARTRAKTPRNYVLADKLINFTYKNN